MNKMEELYNSIINDVVDNLRGVFSEEGLDEQILTTLKDTWLRKLRESQPRRIAATIPQAATNSSRPPNDSTTTAASAVAQPSQLQANTAPIPQLDGSNGTSDEDDNEDESDGDFPDDDVDVSDEEERETDTNRDDEDPLNSEDDVSNDESSEMFETDNVVVCQYDKITRNRNKWKFHLKDGIMNINGRDYVFQKAVGDAEW